MIDHQLPTEPAPAEDPYAALDYDQLLDEAIAVVSEARPAPMSSMVKVNRDDLLDILEQAQVRLPDEIRAARWLLKEKAEFLAEAQRERDAIIDQGRLEVMRMVERQEVIRAAERRARQIVDEARADARLMRRQTEEYCDQKLGSFEAVLDRTIRTVQQGRQKLLGPPPPPPTAVDLTTPIEPVEPAVDVR